jgi:GNAT superfamily N-acetyltransferase
VGMTRGGEKAAGISVRGAGPQDAAAVADLSGQLGYPASVEDMRRRIEQIGEDGDCLLLVAESGASIVAWVLVHVCRLVTSECIAQVSGLVVDETHRNSGIGALLMERAERWAQENKCRGVLLSSRSTREDAHNFYKRLGYSHVKTQEVFLKKFEIPVA